MVRARSPQSNRSDLRVPNVEAPAQEYGERSAQQAAQRAVPVAAPPGQPGAPTQAGASAPTPAPSDPIGGAPSQGLPPVSGPGILPFLHPSNRPSEPVTAGLPTGAGPGPESLTGVGAVAANQAVEQGTLKNLLATLANAPASSSSIRDLADIAGAG